ncbi:MAG: translation initiation factor IF-3 [Desulfovibrio sp.]|nr:translation initiation factor IF-3 [Desulfovibrio sp.]
MASPNLRPRRVEPQDSVRRNEQIRVREVRLIGEDGEQLGIIERSRALQMAQDAGCDLVEVAAAADPPVCRIMDYGRFKYEAQKKKQEARKRQTVIQIKEIKLRPKTDEHDYLTKIGHIRRFIENGDRCKVTIFFRGREIVHKDRGQTMLDKVVEDTRDIAKVDQEARAEGRTLYLMLAPLPKK